MIVNKNNKTTQVVYQDQVNFLNETYAGVTFADRLHTALTELEKLSSKTRYRFLNQKLKDLGVSEETITAINKEIL